MPNPEESLILPPHMDLYANNSSFQGLDLKIRKTHCTAHGLKHNYTKQQGLNRKSTFLFFFLGQAEGDGAWGGNGGAAPAAWRPVLKPTGSGDVFPSAGVRSPLTSLPVVERRGGAAPVNRRWRRRAETAARLRFRRLGHREAARVGT